MIEETLEEKSIDDSTVASFLAALDQLDPYAGIRGVLSKVEEELKPKLDSVLDRENLNAIGRKFIGCNTTLYGPIAYGRKETAYTRAIAWALDPNNCPKFAEGVINSLLQEKLSLVKQRKIKSISQSDPEFKVGAGYIDVKLEGTFKGGGRWTIGIEAKVDALEGKDQLSKYAAALKEELSVKGSEGCLIYLVPSEAEKVKNEAEKKKLEEDGVHFSQIDYCYLAHVFMRNLIQYGKELSDLKQDYLLLLISGLVRDIEKVELSSNSPLDALRVWPMLSLFKEM